MKTIGRTQNTPIEGQRHCASRAKRIPVLVLVPHTSSAKSMITELTGLLTSIKSTNSLRHPCSVHPAPHATKCSSAYDTFLCPFRLDRYREQIEKINRLKEDTVRAVIKNSSDIVAFKDEVSKQLQYLRDFAEAN